MRSWAWFFEFAIAVAGAGASTVYYRDSTNSYLVAREADNRATLIPDDPASTKLLGFAVHEAGAKFVLLRASPSPLTRALYWSDGSAIWRAGLDGSGPEIHVGAMLEVTWIGAHFGHAASDVTLTVEDVACVDIVAWSPTRVTCVMARPARTVASTKIPLSRVQIATSAGATPGVQPDFDALVSTPGYAMPLVQAITVTTTLLNPHTLAIDAGDRAASSLYFSDHAGGRVYLASTLSSSLRVLLSGAWSVHGLFVLGRSLYFTAEANGTVQRVDLSTMSSVTVPGSGRLVDFAWTPPMLHLLYTTLYVAEKGGKLLAASTSGTPGVARRVLGGSTMARLNGVALGPDGTLYWTETNTNVVARTSLTSVGRQVLVGGQPQSILSWPRHVYALSSGTGLYYTEYAGRISLLPLPGAPSTVVNAAVSTTALGQLDGRVLGATPLDALPFYALE
uniref:Secreted protein n=1 Tax=Achlya hypogyna TaxID=1202772 RepID=A0A0A7CPE8_ACHHY|nr:secreted protein [Achlya hypogyna]